MINAIRIELLKLRTTRLTYGLLLAGAAITALFTILEAALGGKKGGSAGGKMSLRTMTPWQRKVRAHKAGLEGGAPRKIDHERVRALRAAARSTAKLLLSSGLACRA